MRHQDPIESSLAPWGPQRRVHPIGLLSAIFLAVSTQAYAASSVTKTDQKSTVVEVVAEDGAGAGGELHFFAVNEEERQLSPTRSVFQSYRWCLLHTDCAGCQETVIECGDSPRAALARNGNRVRFSHAGYVLRCDTQPNSRKICLNQPSSTATAQQFDGSTPSFERTSSVRCQIDNLRCALTLPSGQSQDNASGTLNFGREKFHTNVPRP